MWKGEWGWLAVTTIRSTVSSYSHVGPLLIVLVTWGSTSHGPSHLRIDPLLTSHLSHPSQHLNHLRLTPLLQVLVIKVWFIFSRSQSIDVVPSLVSVSLLSSSSLKLGSSSHSLSHLRLAPLFIVLAMWGGLLSSLSYSLLRLMHHSMILVTRSWLLCSSSYSLLRLMHHRMVFCYLRLAPLLFILHCIVS